MDARADLPDVRLEFEVVKRAALQLRKSFAAIGLESFALLSGAKGIHVVVPLAPVARWPAVRRFAKSFCSALAEPEPERFTGRRRNRCAAGASATRRLPGWAETFEQAGRCPGSAWETALLGGGR